MPQGCKQAGGSRYTLEEATNKNGRERTTSGREKAIAQQLTMAKMRTMTMSMMMVNVVMPMATMGGFKTPSP